MFFFFLKNKGVKQDGSAAHLFHQAIKAYNTGTRKRRKIHDDDLGDVRWHKTGKTKPVILDGVHRGCKKIMVLYTSIVRGAKPEKTNWVMHQYHLGTGEEEKDGEYVISKVFYQQQQVKQSDKVEQDFPESCGSLIAKVDPLTPKSATPEHPLTERRNSNFYPGQESPIACMDTSVQVKVKNLCLDASFIFFFCFFHPFLIRGSKCCEYIFFTGLFTCSYQLNDDITLFGNILLLFSRDIVGA